MNPKYTHRTRSGLPARIVCTDRTGELPVLALVLDKGGIEHITTFSKSLSFTDDVEDHGLDLFEAKPWEFERPSTQARHVGDKLSECLVTAQVRSSMGGLGGSPKFDLNDYPEELRDLIKAFVDDELSAVEALYIAMRRAEAQHAGQ